MLPSFIGKKLALKILRIGKANNFINLCSAVIELPAGSRLYWVIPSVFVHHPFCSTFLFDSLLLPHKRLHRPPTGELLLLGLDVFMQEVEIEGKTWYRVMVGPLDSELDRNRAQDKLAQAQIESLPLQVRNEP